MLAQIQNRRGPAASWTAVNPVLADGEVGYETDTGLFKIGRNGTAWNDLTYHNPDDQIIDNGDGTWTSTLHGVSGYTVDGLSAATPGQIAFAENRTGTVTSGLVGSPIPVPYCVVRIKPTDYNVELRWGCYWGITTTGQGALYSLVYEATDGLAVPIDSHSTYVTTLTPPSAQVATHRGSTDIGPSDRYRAFGLYAQVSQEGSSLTAYVRNLSTKAGSSWLKAVAL